MIKNKTRLFGSKRPRYFKEPKKQSSRSLYKKRPQRVRFRRRFATSVFKSIVKVESRSIFTVSLLGGVVWGGMELTRFWRNSPWLEIQDVQYRKDIPKQLAGVLNISVGNKILALNRRVLENEGLRVFPQLATLKVERNFRRQVTVTGSYRQAVGKISEPEKAWGVDSQGFIFPYPNSNETLSEIPTLPTHLSEPQLQVVSKVLHQFKTQLPEFYSQLERLETDTIYSWKLIMSKGILVYWGEIFENETVEKGKNILALLDQYKPAKGSGTLQFVEKNRVVMKTHWVKKKG